MIASALKIDAYAPEEVAVRVEQAAIAKATQPFVQVLALGVLAGAFIAFGAMAYTLTITDSGLGFGPTRLLGGAAFSLGLILVVVAGAELFTGNNLIVMAWADRQISTGQLLWDWGLVYVGNLVGALGMVVLIRLAHLDALGSYGETAAAIATAKVKMAPDVAFFRAVLCNILVCLAVWLAMAAHSVASKILAIVFPITAFVALGFEHSVANMYLIPAGLMAGGAGLDEALLATFENLVPVTLGNIVGGGVLVALVYWLVYLRGRKRSDNV